MQIPAEDGSWLRELEAQADFVKAASGIATKRNDTAHARWRFTRKGELHLDRLATLTHSAHQQAETALGEVSRTAFGGLHSGGAGEDKTHGAIGSERMARRAMKEALFLGGRSAVSTASAVELIEQLIQFSCQILDSR